MTVFRLTESLLTDESASPRIGTDCRRAGVQAVTKPAALSSCLLDFAQGDNTGDDLRLAVAVSQFTLAQRLQCLQITANVF